MRYLGGVFQEQGKLEKATAAYQKTVEIDPNNLSGNCCLGSVYII